MKVTKTFSCDFETTVYEGQTRTDVWAAALVELGTETVHIYNSIWGFWKFLYNQYANLNLYFHNLKFDGSFILNFIKSKLKCKEGALYDDNGFVKVFKDKKDLQHGEYIYSISDKGQWYTITLRWYGRTYTFKDSLKLLPFSVAEIGNAFKTKHRKLTMDYKGVRKPGGIITPLEKRYIANDVLVVKEALEQMFAEGHTKLTIGSCCLAEYKRIFKERDAFIKWEDFYPNLYDVSLDEKLYGYSTVGRYILKAYHGAWCYVAPGAEGKVIRNGLTADVNSLYPFVMHSSSGNRYPAGYPWKWKGDYIPDSARSENKYFFVRLRTRFQLKQGKLPFIQLKGNYLYPSTKMLETSDIWDEKQGVYCASYIDRYGKEVPATVEMTLCQDDYELVLDHYHLYDTEILDGMYFQSEIGLFDEYINKWIKVKMTSKGALRTMAKLYLNNLYGKFASTTNSSFKVGYLKEDGSLGFYQVAEDEKEPGYIPVGACITAKARRYTVEHAQKNYHGPDAPGFKYADTDSIHCDLSPDELIDINVDPVKLGCWKLESYWDTAIFCRQKTYIEHVTHSDGDPVEPYYAITCAGMPKHCKNLMESRLEGRINKEIDETKLTKQEKFFIYGETAETEAKHIQPMNITDLKVGLWVPGKLRPKQMPGGVLLEKTDFRIR